MFNSFLYVYQRVINQSDKHIYVPNMSQLREAINPKKNSRHVQWMNRDPQCESQLAEHLGAILCQASKNIHST